MKLISLTLDNFRQFHGKQNPIKFSDDPDKNVTIIFGANGAGKSTILNAFTWTFYHETTASFENPDNIISEKALIEAEEGELINGRVSIEFEHKGVKYIASRTRVEKKTGSPDKTEVREKGLPKLMIIGTDGQAEESDNPEDHIEQVLPKRLYKFFFFDGERIEQLAKDSAYEEIEHAIKNILGLQILDRSIRHLQGDVKTILDKRLSRVGTEEIQEIIQEIQALEKQKEKKIKEQENEKKNIHSLNESIDAVKERLRTLEETKGVQEKIDELERDLKDLTDQILNKNKEIKSEINRSGYAAFLSPLLDKSYGILEEKREKKELPSGIKKQFVQDLLNGKTCICGAKLKENGEPTEHYYEVEKWLNKAGSSDIEQHAMTVGLQLNSLNERRNSLLEKVHELQRQKSKMEEKKGKVVARRSELKHQLDDKDSEEVQDLVNRQEDLENQVTAANQIIGGLKEKISIIDDELEVLEKKKEEADAANEKANLIKKKLKIRSEALEFFEELYSLMSEEVRKQLDERVREVHESISFKDFWTEITKDFRLILRKGLGEEVEREVAKSTGESQITSLAFIGSIADYARNFSKDQGINKWFGFEGGVYPIIMDSPFGNLDDNYRESVAEGIPKLAEQIVVIVSKSQGKGIVLDQLKSRIHNAYVLSFRTKKSDKDVVENFKYSGKSYPYIGKSDDSFETAEIIEMK